MDETHNKMREQYKNNIVNVLYFNAKRRAKKKQVPFDITKDDIDIPEYCPVLGINIEVNNSYAKASSPTIDRIIPQKGYVKGNIKVISYRANTIKNDATIDELKKIIDYLEKECG